MQSCKMSVRSQLVVPALTALMLPMMSAMCLHYFLGAKKTD